MQLFLLNTTIYILAFIAIWIGAGLIVDSASRFSERLKFSSFAFSFIFLGLMTTTPEFSVGLQAVKDNNPEIFTGNLLGGIIVLFLLVMPLLAVLGNGINLKHDLSERTLAILLFILAFPSFLILDGKITNLEGLTVIALYIILIFLVERRKGIFDNSNEKLFNIKSYSHKDILKILIGFVALFMSSGVVAEKTIYFADFFKISAFYIGLLVIAIGTNIPEISIAVRSAIEGKKDIALGNYLGSASANTLLFGFFTLLSERKFLTANNFHITFIFTALALLLFFVLSYKKRYISRRSGFILLLLYAVFVVVELAA
ncbi:MAG: sodium:calcium antiporter [Candidatus Levybacteria bacterium]|nr:sodium:calcium antiporter [Candidatus Levybacteria bacterium]